MEELKKLILEQAQVNAAQARQITALSDRVAALEKASPGPQVARVVDALNEFGAMWAKLQQNQTRTDRPIEPWRPV